VLGASTLLTGAFTAANGMKDAPRVLAQTGAAAAPAATPTPSPSPSALPAVTPPVPHGPLDIEDLEGRLVVPSGGYERLSDRTLHLGSMTPDALIRRVKLSAAEAQDARVGLRLVHMQKAFGHAYSGEVLSAFIVMRFRTADDAATFLRYARADEHQGVFRSRTVPGAFAQVETSKGFSTQIGMFARGRFVYEVDVITTAPERDHANFNGLLKLQRDLAFRSDPL
jgi:hypothetical protein